MCIFQRKYEKIKRHDLKTKLKCKNINSNKRILKGYLSHYWQRYNTIAEERITQYMHQIACSYILVPQQK